MGEIYRNSALTITAISGKNGASGCFSNRDGLLNRPCRIWKSTPDFFEPSDNMYVFPSYKSGPDDIVRRRGLLDTRIWVLQEQLLPPRILNYAEDEVFWECVTSEISERILEGIPADERHDRDFIHVFKSAL
jgi:hypothetical protein